jgi:hypothetical protein
LIWPITFASRLESWNLLRDSCLTLDTKSTLQAINSWWFDAPWRPYYLHWDDQPNWPDPWQLLSDNHYCDLARALGILYTITLLDRADLGDATLVLTDSGDNLVLVEKSKYILNWDKDTIVNTNQETTIKKQLTQSAVKQQYL